MQLLRQGHALRLDLGETGVGLARAADGGTAAAALDATYAGERTITLGFGGLRVVRPTALRPLLDTSLRLLEPWAEDGRLELKALRSTPRRIVVDTLRGRADYAFVAVLRRGVVLAPAIHGGTLDGLSANCRKMLVIADRDGERCVWCGASLSFRSLDATLDHVICRSRGGSNSIDNLVLACARCNHGRADMPAETWLARCLAHRLPVDEAAVTAALRRAARVERRTVPLREAA